MDALEAIMTRRSIRRYTTQPVAEALIRRILEAAMMAPSAGDQRPWHFIVVQNKETLHAIADFHPHASMLREAPLAIVICGDQRLEKHPGYWVQDCSAAMQNLLLAAHALGLGAVWLGVYPREERVDGVCRLMGLPPEILPLGIAAIGYPAEQKKQPSRYDPAKIHDERWGIMRSLKE